ncbi:MAG: ATP-binding protein, partial [Chloroflexi bacterium]|nr:ATP-binding protein [Chloroflexota bacterium]
QPSPETILVFPRDLLRFLYWLVLKPITLRGYFYRLGVRITTSLITLWRRGKEQPALRQLVWLGLFHMIVTSWLLTGTGLLILSPFGLTVNWLGVVVGVAAGVGAGVVAGVVVAVVFGVANSAGLGVSVAAGGVAGVVVGVAGGVALGTMLSRVGRRVARVVAIGVVYGVWFGVSSSVGVGVASGVSFIISYFRLWLYIVELPLTWFIAWRARWSPTSLALWRFLPIVWHETTWLPLWSLDRYLTSLAQADREAGALAIAFVAQSFRQQWAARNALIELTAGDIEQARTAQAIANIAEQFAWLPATTLKDLEEILPPIRDIASRARAALNSDTLYNKQTQWRDALAQTRQVRAGLAFDRNQNLVSRFGRALETWEQVFARELADLQTEEAIPNVYVAGSPLMLESKVFKGRRDLFVALERELASAAEQAPTLMLYGPRRAGKSSALKQLPVRLGPDYIPVEVDLQSGVVAESAIGLLAYIGQQVVHNALTHRRLRLPMLASDALSADAYMRFLDWVAQVESQLSGRQRILLNLDEFERMERMVREGRLDTRMFDLLRGLIQHHPRWVVLLSGSHMLEDLSPFWSDYLINVRVLRVGALAEADARELIVKPIPEFSLTYDDDAVSAILAATGCQPYLVQVVCHDLVNRLNEEKRLHATRDDAEWALESCMTSGVAYFKDLWDGGDTSDMQRELMGALAVGKDLSGFGNVTGLNKSLRQLVNREILETRDGTYHFRVGLVRRWVERQT